MTKKVINTLLLTSLILMSCLSFSSAQAAKGKKEKAAPASKSISAQKAPWKGIPWVIGGVLSAAAVAVSFKDARRVNVD